MTALSAGTDMENDSRTMGLCCFYCSDFLYKKLEVKCCFPVFVCTRVGHCLVFPEPNTPIKQSNSDISSALPLHELMSDGDAV